jgi:hypothetical protein
MSCRTGYLVSIGASIPRASMRGNKIHLPFCVRSCGLPCWMLLDAMKLIQTPLRSIPAAISVHVIPPLGPMDCGSERCASFVTSQPDGTRLP